MPVISRVNHNELKELLSSDYKFVQSRLRKILTADELSYFAETSHSGTERRWEVNNNNPYKRYTEASEEEKDIASDLIRDKLDSIKPKMAQDPQLKGIIEYILTIPSEDQIYIFTDSTGNTSVSIAQWGFVKENRANDLNPLNKVVNRPKSDHTQVDVVVKYTDGELAANADLYFFYKSVVKPISTDDGGIKKLGQLKNGAKFSIASSPEGMVDRVDLFVEEGRELYPVEIPFYSTATVTVKNQDGEVLPHMQIRASHNSLNQLFTTDEEGKFEIEKVKIDHDPLVLSSASESSITNSYSLSKAHNDLVFEYKVRKSRNIVVKLIDIEDREIVKSHAISASSEGRENKYVSDSNGLIPLSDVAIDEVMRLTDLNDNENVDTFTVDEDTEEYIFKVKRKVEAVVTLHLVDHKNKLLPGIPMQVSLADVHNLKTNEQGNVTLAKKLFTDKQKVPVSVSIKGKKDKLKTYKKAFKYKESESEYTLKLKKFNWLWLLLLLLPLLLLLLIRFEKDVYVQAVYKNSGRVVPNAEVDFEYTKAFLYDEGSLFTAVKDPYKKTTDSMGIARFEKLEYSVYSYIFHHFSPAKIYVNEGCFTSDTLQPKFHGLKSKQVIKINLEPTIVSATFQVVDDEDDYPLPNALVLIKSKINGETFIDSSRTNANGEVVFNNLPKCGNVDLLKGSLKGYFPEQYEDVSVEKYLADPTQRQIRLVAEKDQIEFFVVSCLTGEPLPNSIATISIFDGIRSSTQTQYTNVRGQGKHVHEDLSILDKIEIEAKNPPYYKPGQLGKSYTVEEFVKLPDSLRTICLEPEENPLEFVNVEEGTNRPLAGVSNRITISSPKGTREIVVISNVNGKFTVAGVKDGEKITIVSTYDPNYVPNDYTIVDEDIMKLLKGSQKERTIPLKPKEVTLTFRTLDEAEGTILPDVTLSIYIDNQGPISPGNSGDGTFEVTARLNSTVSIVASKTGYDSNDTKIRNDAFSFLLSSLQDERDIPLKLPPCGFVSESRGGSINLEQSYNMGQKSGEFIFEYMTDNEADRMTVYCGSTVIFDEKFSTGIDSNDDGIYQKFTLQFNGCNTIRVVVEGGSTNWGYKINCPQ